jgi:hypothetical protein
MWRGLGRLAAWWLVPRGLTGMSTYCWNTKNGGWTSHFLRYNRINTMFSAWQAENWVPDWQLDLKVFISLGTQSLWDDSCWDILQENTFCRAKKAMLSTCFNGNFPFNPTIETQPYWTMAILGGFPSHGGTPSSHPFIAPAKDRTQVVQIPGTTRYAPAALRVHHRTSQYMGPHWSVVYNPYNHIY